MIGSLELESYTQPDGNRGLADAAAELGHCFGSAVKDDLPPGEFWLINDEGRRQPVYFTLQKYYKRRESGGATFSASGTVFREFGQAAAEWLR